MTPIKISATPEKTHVILNKDSFSETPINPTVVVIIRIIGPIKANELLTNHAFSMLFSLNISAAAKISTLPENRRSKTIIRTAFSIAKNIVPSSVKIHSI